MSAYKYYLTMKTDDELLKTLREVDLIINEPYETETSPKTDMLWRTYNDSGRKERAFENKSSIVHELYRRDRISDDEMTNYWLSEDFKFTPKINY